MFTVKDLPIHPHKRRELARVSSVGIFSSGSSPRLWETHDTVRVAKDVAELIEKEHDRGNQVIVNVSGGRKPQAFGALFGAYARNDMVQRIVYVTEEDSTIIDFPVLSFNLSETKKLILEEIQNGVSAVTQIAATAGISKGMTYNHLRELKSMGYIADGDSGYIITDAGKIASI
jgi:CRISPR-associated protein Csa3